jgi:hypothetical protein
MTRAQQEQWPDGVVARTRTVGGATVDIGEWDPSEGVRLSQCTGCKKVNHEYGMAFTPGGNPHMSLVDSRKWAQSHAETCRFIPEPGGAR